MELAEVLKRVEGIKEREQEVHTALGKYYTAVAATIGATAAALRERLDSVAADEAKVRLAGELAVSIATVWAAQYGLDDPSRGWQTLSSFVYDLLEGSGWTASDHGTTEPDPHKPLDKELYIFVHRVGV